MSDVTGVQTATLPHSEVLRTLLQHIGQVQTARGVRGIESETGNSLLPVTCNWLHPLYIHDISLERLYAVQWPNGHVQSYAVQRSNESKRTCRKILTSFQVICGHEELVRRAAASCSRARPKGGDPTCPTCPYLNILHVRRPNVAGGQNRNMKKSCNPFQTSGPVISVWPVRAGENPPLYSSLLTCQTSMHWHAGHHTVLAPGMSVPVHRKE